MSFISNKQVDNKQPICQACLSQSLGLGSGSPTKNKAKTKLYHVWTWFDSNPTLDWVKDKDYYISTSVYIVYFQNNPIF